MPESANAVSQDRGISYLYIAAAFVIVVAGMRAAEAIVNPLLLSVFLSVISAPAYFALLKRNVPNWLALLTVVAVLSGIVIGVLYVVVESVAGFTARQDEYLQQIHRETRILRRQFENLMPAWAKPAAETKRADSTDDDADPDGAEPNNADTGAGSSDSGAEPDVGSTLSGKSDSEDSPRDARSSPTQTSAADTVPGLNPNSAPTAAAEFSEDRPAGDGETQTGSVADAEERVNPAAPAGSAATKQDWQLFMEDTFNPGTVISLVQDLAQSLVQILSNVFLVLLTVIFILLEVGSFSRKIETAFVRTEEANQRAQQIVNSIQHYIVIKTWVSLATGVLVVIWLKLFGVPYAGLWGLLAFLFNYIPNVGSVIAAVPAILIACLELGMLPAAGAAVGFLIVNGVIGNFVEPRLMGKGLGLSPLVVFCSMVFWGWVLGPIGMLLSVPLTMTARIALDGFDDTKWVATMLGS